MAVPIILLKVLIWYLWDFSDFDYLFTLNNFRVCAQTWCQTYFHPKMLFPTCEVPWLMYNQKKNCNITTINWLKNYDILLLQVSNSKLHMTPMSTSSHKLFAIEKVSTFTIRDLRHSSIIFFSKIGNIYIKKCYWVERQSNKKLNR